MSRARWVGGWEGSLFGSCRVVDVIIYVNCLIVVCAHQDGSVSIKSGHVNTYIFDQYWPDLKLYKYMFLFENELITARLDL